MVFFSISKFVVVVVINVQRQIHDGGRKREKERKKKSKMSEILNFNFAGVTSTALSILNVYRVTNLHVCRRCSTSALDVSSFHFINCLAVDMMYDDE